jgi:hypothetical protein
MTEAEPTTTDSLSEDKVTEQQGEQAEAINPFEQGSHLLMTLSLFDENLYKNLIRSLHPDNQLLDTETIVACSKPGLYSQYLKTIYHLIWQYASIYQRFSSQEDALTGIENTLLEALDENQNKREDDESRLSESKLESLKTLKSEVTQKRSEINSIGTSDIADLKAAMIKEIVSVSDMMSKMAGLVESEAPSAKSIQPSFDALEKAMSTYNESNKTAVNRSLNNYKTKYEALLTDTEHDETKLKALCAEWLTLIKQATVTKESS